MLDKKLKIKKPKSRTLNGEKKKIKNLKEYLQSCPNDCEIFRFDTQDETDRFGNDLKEIAKEEENAPTIFDLQMFDIKITALTVRVYLLQPELIIN